MTVALVTGGATGIGRACALGFARKRIDVAIVFSRSDAEAEETVHVIEDAGARAEAIKADVSDDAAVRAAVARTVGRFGGIDYVVNAAGTTRFVPENLIDEVTAEDWDDMIGVNTLGIFHTCRAAAPNLRQSRGAIVNIGSTSALTGRGSSIPYAVSKAGVVTLTQALARALAPEVRVNSVAPGIVNTRWIAGREEHVKRLSAGTPLDRLCEPEDVADVVLFFALDACFVTGQTLIVDGGKFL